MTRQRPRKSDDHLDRRALGHEAASRSRSPGSAANGLDRGREHPVRVAVPPHRPGRCPRRPRSGRPGARSGAARDGLADRVLDPGQRLVDLSGSVPPPWATSSLPPPPPPRTSAATRTSSPALRPHSRPRSLTATTTTGRPPRPRRPRPPPGARRDPAARRRRASRRRSSAPVPSGARWATTPTPKTSRVGPASSRCTASNRPWRTGSRSFSPRAAALAARRRARAAPRGAPSAPR